MSEVTVMLKAYTSNRSLNTRCRLKKQILENGNNPYYEKDIMEIVLL